MLKCFCFLLIAAPLDAPLKSGMKPCVEFVAYNSWEKSGITQDENKTSQERELHYAAR